MGRYGFMFRKTAACFGLVSSWDVIDGLNGMGWYPMVFDGMGWHGMVWDVMGWGGMGCGWDGKGSDGVGWYSGLVWTGTRRWRSF